MNPEEVYEIKLKIPIVYYHNRNPKIEKIIALKFDCQSSRILANGFSILWWELEKIIVWYRGKIVSFIYPKDLFPHYFSEEYKLFLTSGNELH